MVVLKINLLGGRNFVVRPDQQSFKKSACFGKCFLKKYFLRVAVCVRLINLKCTFANIKVAISANPSFSLRFQCFNFFFLLVSNFCEGKLSAASMEFGGGCKRGRHGLMNGNIGFKKSKLGNFFAILFAAFHPPFLIFVQLLIMGFIICYLYVLSNLEFC